MSDTALRFSFLKDRDTASPHMRKVAAEADRMNARMRVSSLASLAATVAVAAGFASLGAHAIAAGAAIAPVAGLLAAMPAGVVATVVGVGSLALGFAGLGAAMKQTASGGGAASQAIAAAERRVEMAQRSAIDAQMSLNDARAEAADRLADMSRELARARLDEESATLAVTEAQLRLREARRGGDRTERARADLGYRQAVQSLDEVRARLADVTEEEQKRRDAGVEGSDEVQSAIERQADAVYELAAAQEALKQSQSGGGGVDKAAEAYAKLTAEGKALVDVLKSLKPEWRAVQQAVQGALFAGVAGDVRSLASAWFPMLRTQLAGVASGWNTALRSSAQLAATPGFVADMNSSLGNTVSMSEALGRAWAPFLSGFRHFVTVGSTFLPEFGGWVQSLAERFERWAAAARDSGRAHAWIETGVTVLGNLWAVAKNLGGAIAAIFRAGDAPGWLPGLVTGTAALRGFLESAEGQAKMAAVFTTLRDVGSQMLAVLQTIGPVLLDMFSAGGLVTDTMSVFGVVVGFAADHLGFLQEHLGTILGLFVAYKTIQAAATVVGIADLPIRAAMAISMWRHTAALRANTLAMNTQMGIEKKGLITRAALKVATIASAVASGIATAAQWLWNIAMMANPIGLIIIAIIAVIAVFVLLWMKSEGFRNFFIGMWDHIWGFLKMIGGWFAGPFVDFFVNAWRFVERVFSWSNIVAGFKAGINLLIRAWNAIDFGIHIQAPSWLGGFGFHVDDIVPDIPYLASGGDITRGGMAMVGEEGPEAVMLPAGARVLPNSAMGGETRVVVEFDFRGADSEMAKALRKMVRVKGGGNVQVAFGGGA